MDRRGVRCRSARRAGSHAGYTDISFEPIDAGVLAGSSRRGAAALHHELGPTGEIYREAGMRDILANRDNPTRKAYLSALLASIEVYADRIRIVGSR